MWKRTTTLGTVLDRITVHEWWNDGESVSKVILNVNRQNINRPGMCGEGDGKRWDEDDCTDGRTDGRTDGQQERKGVKDHAHRVTWRSIKH